MSEPIQTDELKRAGSGLDVDQQLVTDISQLVQTAQPAMVMNIVADMYPADLALLLRHLPADEALQLFEWLPTEIASDVLPELEPNLLGQLLEQTREHRVATLLDELDTDDAVDILNELPADVTWKLLPTLEDAGDLRDLLAYEEDTAGGIMGTELVAVPLGWNIAEATEEVRRHADLVEPVYSVFVIDDVQRLVGTVTLKKLLLTAASEPIEKVMETDIISVTPEMDQEEVARIMERYDLVSLAVVNEEGRLLGRITIDDVVDVIREEAEEDIQLMHGVSAGEEPTDNIFRISRGRLPWLLVGLFGAGMSGLVIGTFEESLEQAVVLAMFIPIVTAMGGNAAVQSAAIAVQGLSSGDFWPGDVIKRLSKEAFVAMLNGVVLALVVGVVVMLFGLGDIPRLALTVALTMFTVILLATTNGALVPFVLHRLGIDPASAMGPFVTTLNDIIGLTVYFLIASLLYL
ncbi:MAG: magnesium transporter, partial [Bacteroidota bacterium]